MPAADILLVEDSPSVLRPLTRVVEQGGYRAHTAESRAALQARLAAGLRPLAAVLDYCLPDAPEGEALADLIAAGIPTLVLTARNDAATRERVMAQPVVDYVPKDMPGALEYVAMLLRRLDRNRALFALVIDDSRTVRQHLKQLLERYQFRVLLAGGADEAIRALAAEPAIRLVLVDQDMPGMDGIALTHRIRRAYGRDRLAIIGISGASDSTTTARFIKAGADDFLKKPFNAEEFHCRITHNVEFLENMEALVRAANHDPLTGLPNRRAFFAASEQLGQPYCVAMLDVDHFKSVNDRYGHDGGDRALTLLAEQLYEHFPGETCARLGGEEFAVIFASADIRAVHARLDAFRMALAAQVLNVRGRPLRVTVSVGVSDAGTDGIGGKLAQADERLYRAKAGGRNRVVSLDGADAAVAG